MSIKERKRRLREATRARILSASLEIVKKDGWQALSMRRIGEMIEYTSPVIYEYFSSKEAILIELARRGYISLYQQLVQITEKVMMPDDQLEDMFLAYWEFAVTNRELYQLMFGVDMQSCCHKKLTMESDQPALLIQAVIKRLMIRLAPDDETITAKYIILWSSVHGLISLCLIGKTGTNLFDYPELRTVARNMITSLLN